VAGRDDVGGGGEGNAGGHERTEQSLESHDRDYTRPLPAILGPPRPPPVVFRPPFSDL